MKNAESRVEFLDLAVSCGAVLTGKPDGSEPITVVFTPEAWREFDKAVDSQQPAVAQVAAVPNNEIPTELLKALNKHCCNNVAWIRHAWAEYIVAAPSPAQPAPGGDAVELPEPWQLDLCKRVQPEAREHYARDQMISYGDARYQQGRAAGIVEAAKVCESGLIGRPTIYEAAAMRKCTAAIRAFAAKPAEGRS